MISMDRKPYLTVSRPGKPGKHQSFVRETQRLGNQVSEWVSVYLCVYLFVGETAGDGRT